MCKKTVHIIKANVRSVANQFWNRYVAIHATGRLPRQGSAAAVGLLYGQLFASSCSQDTCSRTIIRKTFFAGNVVRGVSCSPDSYAHVQLAAQVNWYW